MRCGLYLRVSTKDQDAAMQEAELRAYCQRRSWEVAAVYQDVISGAKDRRPALSQLMENARGGRFDVVAVYRLDRLGRSLPHLLATVNELHVHGVSFISLSESLDFTSPAGEFMFAVIGAVAQFERAIIRQRVKSGIDQARRSGRRLGRPANVMDAAKIVALRSHGCSWAEVSRQIGQKVGACRNAHARYKVPSID